MPKGFFNPLNSRRSLKVPIDVCSHFIFFCQKADERNESFYWQRPVPQVRRELYSVYKLLLLYISFHLNFTEAPWTVLFTRLSLHEDEIFISGLTTYLFIIYLFEEINSYAVAKCTNSFIIFTPVCQFPHILHFGNVSFFHAECQKLSPHS